MGDGCFGHEFSHLIVSRSCKLCCSAMHQESCVVVADRSLTGLARGLVLVHGILTLLWAWVIGYSPRNIQTPWLRTASYVSSLSLTFTLPAADGEILHPILSAVYLAAIVAPHLAPSSPLITVGNTAKAVSNLVLGLVTWTWAHRKLIESSWAISGLTPSPGPTKIKPN